MKTKRNKKCAHIYIYTLRDRYLSNLRVTHIRLCNVRANCFACGLCSFSTCTSATAQTCSQDARNAPQTQHTSPVPPPLLQLKPTSPPIPTSTIASYWSPCPISSASHLTQLINHTLMPLKILQVFPMTLRIRGQTPFVAVAFQSRSPVQLFATSWTAAH